MKIKQNKKTNSIKRLLFIHIIEPSVMLDNFEFMSVSKIKKIKKNSIDEIYIGDLLDYLSSDDGFIILQEIVTKLTAGGKLHIQSSDAKCLASALLYNNINIAIYKGLLFNDKKNIYTLTEIKNILSGIQNIKISKCKFINAIQYYIECFKNE